MGPRWGFFLKEWKHFEGLFCILSCYFQLWHGFYRLQGHYHIFDRKVEVFPDYFDGFIGFLHLFVVFFAWEFRNHPFSCFRVYFKWIWTFKRANQLKECKKNEKLISEDSWALIFLSFFYQCNLTWIQVHNWTLWSSKWNDSCLHPGFYWSSS